MTVIATSLLRLYCKRDVLLLVPTDGRFSTHSTLTLYADDVTGCSPFAESRDERNSHYALRVEHVMLAVYIIIKSYSDNVALVM
ncbi:hypothetical protein BaRGS_00034870 [Batillaria attramentaria]|uniref:Uncharacterized protein n=1 Tax=Batillaria attramentaria TaxID=370345 RepID=A0ABD0JGY4_9CAEN